MRSTGMSSGCISKTDWEQGYGFYYVNLSHFEQESDDNTSKSVQVLFTNAVNTAINLDFQLFIYFEKQIGIDISVGKCVDV